MKKSPKCFISYSWEGEEHQEWVRSLATKLFDNGVEASLDQWDVKPGQDVQSYMEYSIRESDFVFMICTPMYAKKANEDNGGVGYEKNIITGEIFNLSKAETKFIPILKDGVKKQAIPSFLMSKVYVDLNDKYEENFEVLLRHIYDTPKFEKPQLGEKPSFLNEKSTINDNDNDNDFSQKEGSLDIKLGAITYHYKLPSWWDLVPFEMPDNITTEENFRNHIRDNYASDTGNLDTWKSALKAWAFYAKAKNSLPVYIANCLSRGGEHEEAARLYSELYALIQFLPDKHEWYSVFISYLTGREFKRFGQESVAKYWYNLSIKYLGSKDSTVNYYANLSHFELHGYYDI